MSLQEQLRALMGRERISQNAVASSIGLSPTTLSLWLKGNYMGDVKSVDDLIANFIERRKERTGQKPHTVVAITGWRRTMEALAICHADCEIGVITGDAGVGKTTSLQGYAGKNKDVILLEADMGWTARTVFVELARRLNLSEKGNLHDLFEAVRTQLSNTGRLVVVDEAEHLPYRALEMLRRLHDKAGIGLVLAGMPRLIANLRGRRGEYAQLYSRVGLHAQVGALTDEDIQGIATAVWGDAGAGLWKAMRDITTNARTMGKLVKRAARIAQINDTSITPEVVVAAKQYLIV